MGAGGGLWMLMMGKALVCVCVCVCVCVWSGITLGKTLGEHYGQYQHQQRDMRNYVYRTMFFKINLLTYH